MLMSSNDREFIGRWCSEYDRRNQNTHGQIEEAAFGGQVNPLVRVRDFHQRFMIHSGFRIQFEPSELERELIVQV
jgi:hypothetical protein